MAKTNSLTAYPFLHEEKGEISLHFSLQTIQSRMSKARPGILLLEYTRFMMGFLLFVPQPEKIVMIGLGGGSLAKYCREKLPDTKFIAVEISPEVIALKDTFDIPDEDEHFAIINDDGADYVRQMKSTHGQADVLLVDGFDERGQPKQLCSEEFYAHCYEALRPSGILVVNLCVGDLSHKKTLNRIRTAFHSKALAISAEGGTNSIVFASRSVRFPPDIMQMNERVSRLEPYHPLELSEVAQKILAQAQPQNTRRRWW